MEGLEVHIQRTPHKKVSDNDRQLENKIVGLQVLSQPSGNAEARF